MRTQRSTTHPRHTLRRSDQGATTLIVLVMLLLMMVFIAGNSVSLRALKRDLARIEKVQLRKFAVPAKPHESLPGQSTASPSSQPGS